ncbi:winged helix-turn-helix domain-containing protein [Enterobacter mori]|uniref:winged helix-turn-helix domain-containing protein n=1 Tax=Enterobacter mori TaxID=539813 RepID=UPI001EE49D30|nr:winged helix-turn-helix domain-containing protein [Enterobacter mori]MCG5126889.1 winged helix-turn-helix domain-containing protein [Enterobacter mori]
MKYLIASKVIYDTENGELTFPGAELPEAQKLTNTANRILSLLIASPGQVLERHYLLEQVWESAGHTGSSSSLNQYISILRKTLTSLTDIEESIIVVPKVGFYFSADIDVQLLDQPYAPPSGEDAVPENKKTRSMPLMYSGAALLILVLVVANVWIWTQPKINERYSSRTEVGKLEKCTITTYEHLSTDERQRVHEVLLTAQPELSEKCLKHTAQMMVNIQPSVFYGSSGRIFYSFCPVDPENETLVYCENHYVFNWKMK